MEETNKKREPLSAAPAFSSLMAIASIVLIFIFKRSNRFAEICFIASQMAGLLAIWPIDDLFPFFDFLATSVTFAGKFRGDLPWIPCILSVTHVLDFSNGEIYKLDLIQYSMAPETLTLYWSQ